ncbi:hypothetical protein Avbf_04668 [Armadillidium vulgare]|nr:hypothetical protein Avbf_04668 [Armadillidium vulgare]
MGRNINLVRKARPLGDIQKHKFISLAILSSFVVLISIKLTKNLTEKSEAIGSGFILPILPTKGINTIIVGLVKEIRIHSTNYNTTYKSLSILEISGILLIP